MTSCLWKAALFGCCVGLVTTFFHNARKPATGNDSCFCQLSGQVDDCCCSIEDVDKLNTIHINPRLKNLVTRNYFRYFKLNLKRECPFWTDSDQCAVKNCAIDTCSEDELPAGLQGAKPGSHQENKYSKEANTKSKSCSSGDEESLGDVDTTISDEQKESFKVWSTYDDDSSFCVDLDENGDEAEWVDLLLNPEQYTGYRGRGAYRIWSSIYEENCFLPSKKSRINYADFELNFLSKTCLEKRAFYRTLSGLHASISIHLTYKHILPGSFSTKPRFGPNLDEFKRRFDAETTKGNGPHWLKNLFFTYLLALRAVIKAAPYWKEVEFYTGDLKEDIEVKKIVMELVNTAQSCPSTFDESQMFLGDTEKARVLKEEFRLHYKNITRIMDCVGCTRCRVWGKLQTTGIGTALKILFSSNDWDEIPIVNGEKFSLSRTEIVSLFNALNKLSQSLTLVKEFKKMDEQQGNRVGL
ncbi:ERO1-like protein beta isoform X1 [Clytia hemisphaerica]|uniref:Uncharacterized protein n=1 Tax=Clytia hemisphaerica TaxID=252671 RepID=A0A7M5ULA7_9CNID